MPQRRDRQDRVDQQPDARRAVAALRLEAVAQQADHADEDVEPAPAAVGELRDAIEAADAVLISTPEYNGSIPGGLKNALDWASRPFPANALRGKPVAVIGASTSMFGAVWAQAELRKVLGATGARVVDRELPLAAPNEAFDAEGRLVTDDHHETLTQIVETLVEEAAMRPASRRRRQV